MPKLVVSLADGTDVSHDLTEEVVTLGRLSDNIIQIDDPSVSSHHAQLTLVSQQYHLKDLNSTNGTRVNGQSFGEWQLQDGDQIRFGKIEAVYASEIPADARPLPEAAIVAVVPAETSHRPSDFANESPFKTKKKKKDSAGKTILAFTIVAILVFVGAVASIFMLQPPQ
jgi:pSer/pThr/pTyr-binding forkhead associated (FHA) protein